MTARKPPGARYEDWVERQIREAAERGAFDNLPGAGKPIRGLDRPFTAERWAREWVEREGGDPAAMLPPLLLLRKERAALLDALDSFESAGVLRVTLEDFNHRLLQEYRRPMNGPLIAVGVFDVEETVRTWLARRQAGPGEPR